MMMMNSAYPSTSSSSLKRSISTPGTLFSLKGFTLESPDSVDHHYNDHNSGRGHGASSFKPLSKVSPEELARQLTLIDWSIFSRITRAELKPGQWTGSMKHVLSPNVVDFTRRFNILTFWISDEVLCNRQPKARADVISYFIKVAHHLIDPLKSLYSSYAIFCALTSEPLHRLEKTWAYVSKKDKQMFDKIADLFSQNENSIKLRTFMEEAINRPGGGICIPNLSTFLRDIIHVAENYSENNANRDKNLEKLYGFIEKCQQSNYDFIDLVENVYDSLKSLNYIDELQKFRQDDYYKTSLKLEPNDIELRNNSNKATKLYANRFTSQYDISSHFYINEYDATFDVKSARNLLNKSLNEELFYQTKYQLNRQEHQQLLHHQQQQHHQHQQSQQPNQQLTVPFKPGHRKTNSLEINNILVNMNKNNSLGGNGCGNSGAGGRSKPDMSRMKVNLIDDSPSYDLFLCSLNSRYSHGGDSRKPSLEMRGGLKNRSMHSFPLDSTGSTSTTTTADDADTSSLDEVNESLRKMGAATTYSASELVHAGYISRKTVLKVGKKPSMKFWANYYLGLSNDSLLFFNSKSNTPSKVFPSKPLKTLPLTEWSVAYHDDPHGYAAADQKRNTFTLADKSCTTVYKVRTATEGEAREWVQLIHKVVSNLRCLGVR